eukprot:1642488-Alexandrium_andersonii.AAC.1
MAQLSAQTLKRLQDEASTTRGVLFYVGGAVAKDRTFAQAAKRQQARAFAAAARKLDKLLG